jgi:uncharacterized membrane protein required for colicin V production
MTWTWDYITLVYIAIMVIFIIIGLVKGFTSGIIALFGTTVAFFAAFLLAKPIGNAIYTSSGASLTQTIYDAIVQKVPALAEPIGDSIEAAIPGYLGELGVPEALRGMLTPLIIKMIPEGTSDIVLGTYISETLSNLVFIVGTFLVVFIVLLILVFVLKHILKKLKEIKIIKWADKLLGVIAYGVVGILIISVVSYSLTFVVSMNNSVSDWLIAQLHLADDTIMTPSKWIYEYNLLQRLFNAYL